MGLKSPGSKADTAPNKLTIYIRWYWSYKASPEIESLNIWIPMLRSQCNFSTKNKKKNKQTNKQINKKKNPSIRVYVLILFSCFSYSKTGKHILIGKAWLIFYPFVHLWDQKPFFFFKILISYLISDKESCASAISGFTIFSFKKLSCETYVFSDDSNSWAICSLFATTVKYKQKWNNKL